MFFLMRVNMPDEYLDLIIRALESYERSLRRQADNSSELQDCVHVIKFMRARRQEKLDHMKACGVDTTPEVAEERRRLKEAKTALKLQKWQERRSARQDKPLEPPSQ